MGLKILFVFKPQVSERHNLFFFCLFVYFCTYLFMYLWLKLWLWWLKQDKL